MINIYKNFYEVYGYIFVNFFFLSFSTMNYNLINNYNNSIYIILYFIKTIFVILIYIKEFLILNFQ